MRKNLLNKHLLVLLFGILGLIAHLQAQTWQVLGSSSLPVTGTVSYPKLATTVINKEVIPYLVYADNGIIKVKRFKNFIWEDVGGNVSDGTSSTQCAIAISSSGSIYVAYRDDSNNKSVGVKQYNSVNKSWEAVGGADKSVYANTVSVDYGTSGYSTGYQIALSVDNNNIPYVSYVEGTNTLYVKSFTNGAWNIVGTGPILSNLTRVYSPTLNFDSSNNLYLVCHDMDTGSGTLGNAGFIKMFKFNGTVWSDLTAGTTFSGVRSVASTIDKTNKKLIINFAYAGNGTRSAILYYNLETSTWSQTTAGGAFIGWSNKAATYNSISVDNSGNFYAIWIDDMATAVTKMPIMKKLSASSTPTTATNWIEVNNTGTTGGILGPYDVSRSYTHTAIGAEGTPFAVFVKNGNPIVAGFSASDLNAVVLDVKLASFAAETFTNYIKLSWKTSSETNAKNFIIERSTNGVNFLKLDEVSAKGPSSYSAIDHTPANGINYYRLVQYDNDGKSTIYGPVSANFTLNSSAFAVYPNPSTGKISFNTEGLTGLANVVVSDLQGKVFYTATIQVNSNSSSLNLQSLAAGQYILQVSANGVKKSSKVIIL